MVEFILRVATAVDSSFYGLGNPEIYVSGARREDSACEGTARPHHIVKDERHSGFNF